MAIKCLSIICVTSKSAMTPSFIGLMATIFPGALSSSCSSPTANMCHYPCVWQPPRVPASQFLPFYIHQRIGCAQIYTDIPGKTLVKNAICRLSPFCSPNFAFLNYISPFRIVTTSIFPINNTLDIHFNP